MIRRTVMPATVLVVFAALALAAPALAIGPPCGETPKAKCFGLETLEASLSTTQAGAHPDFTFRFGLEQDPETEADKKGAHDTYAAVRNVHFDAPPGLIGNPDVLGVPQQCAAVELVAEHCPNGSQIGIAELNLYDFSILKEPVYMMAPPAGDVIARVGFIAALIPVYADFKVRSEGDYGLSTEIVDAAAEAKLIEASTTLWGVPAAKSHDTERCTPKEVIENSCDESPPRPPGSRELPFLTNPTRCGVPLSFDVSAASWAEPNRFDSESIAFPQITGCNKLPFGPSVKVEPTTHRAAAPTGLDMTLRLPEAEGVSVLESSQIRDIRIDLPSGLTVNPSSADGLAVCSVEQVRFKRNENSHCPDAAKMASTEFEVDGLPRRMKGAIYLREPEPGNPFRIWVVADDLGAHVKLPGQLVVDKASGQIGSVLFDNPQVPLREVRLLFKSGFRAPLVTPASCGTYVTHYEFTPWSGGPPAIGSAAMRIDEGCDTGAFKPKLSAGTANPAAGDHSPFFLTLNREDGEQNPASLDISLPKGLAANFAGIPRCEGAAAATGACQAASRIGSVTAAVGAGPTPLWIPQAGKRLTAVYLGGPYKGGPLSIIAVVPKQAGPFDFGDEVVRSAVYVDPLTAQATVRSDPLPQWIEGIPIAYRTIHVAIDRPNFTLNPTGCRARTIGTNVISAAGGVAHPFSRFTAANCSSLGFKPRVAIRLKGGTKRGGHPALTAVVRPRTHDANLASTVVTLPHSAFLDQAHIRTICTRVQYAAKQCPPGSIYGHVRAVSPLLDEPLEGPVYLRSSNHNLPDMVLALHGLLDIEAVGRIDSVKGSIRSSFEAIPDAPLTEVVLEMQGGKKGLIVNSTNVCRGEHRAEAKLAGHNGKAAILHPAMAVRCSNKGRGYRRATRR